ncbi:MAG: hypothetical protein SA339_08530 [Methanomassiliicoccus sp.]|nr:hypothetical protein [Methanomassiliicoccus sp.]
MADLSEALNNMWNTIIGAIPSIIAAIIIIIVGVVIGILVGRASNKLVEKFGLERAFDNTSAGKAFRESGMDLSNIVGWFVEGFIVILALIYAIETLNVGGSFGIYLISIADYLPRLLAGILIIILGVVFADLLASFIGKMIKPMFPPQKGEIADMLKNLLFIGLIAFVLLLAFDTMLLSGTTIYPLILGFVIIGVGLTLTDGLVKSIIDEHAEFKEVAGYAKFVLYSIFLIIGAGAIFATFPGVTNIVANISWAFAIALAIMLLPMAYGMTRRMGDRMK